MAVAKVVNWGKGGGQDSHSWREKVNKIQQERRRFRASTRSRENENGKIKRGDWEGGERPGRKALLYLR